MSTEQPVPNHLKHVMLTGNENNEDLLKPTESLNLNSNQQSPVQPQDKESIGNIIEDSNKSVVKLKAKLEKINSLINKLKDNCDKNAESHSAKINELKTANKEAATKLQDTVTIMNLSIEEKTKLEQQIINLENSNNKTIEEIKNDRNQYKNQVIELTKKINEMDKDLDDNQFALPIEIDKAKNAIPQQKAKKFGQEQQKYLESSTAKLAAAVNPALSVNPALAEEENKKESAALGSSGGFNWRTAAESRKLMSSKSFKSSKQDEPFLRGKINKNTKRMKKSMRTSQKSKTKKMKKGIFRNLGLFGKKK